MATLLLKNEIDLCRDPTRGGARQQTSATARIKEASMDPTPDYDLSDELEYGTAAFAWLLRGVYPPPGYPPI